MLCENVDGTEHATGSNFIHATRVEISVVRLVFPEKPLHRHIQGRDLTFASRIHNKLLTLDYTLQWWLVHWTPDWAVQVWPWPGYWVVFSGKTLYSHGASLHPGEK